MTSWEIRRAEAAQILLELRDNVPGFAMYPHEIERHRQKNELAEIRHCQAIESRLAEREAFAAACLDDLDRERYGI